MSDELSAWIEAEAAAKQHYAEKFGLDPMDVDILRAAMIRAGVEDSQSLLDRMWTVTALVELLAEVDFGALADYEEVEFSQSILPEGISRRFDEETVSQNGEKWRIHKYDVDPFPGLPHAHNVFNDIKLDLSNGNLYRKRKLIGKMPRKELNELRSRVKNIKLP
jgi:hypothetical protein